MKSSVFIAASAGIILFLGLSHLFYTFCRTPALLPTTRMNCQIVSSIVHLSLCSVFWQAACSARRHGIEVVTLGRFHPS